MARLEGVSNLLKPFLDQQGLVMLDGGLATELEARGSVLTDELWSARVLMEQPELIRAVHLDYLAAGADCIITSTYQATIEGFVNTGLSVSQALELLKCSLELALEARDAFWEPSKNRRGRIRPLVAASVGPYGAYLADGSEFRGDYDLSEEALVRFHRTRWQVLVESGADLLACETIPARKEALALRRLLSDTPTVSAWFSFSCKDDRHISDGTELAAVAQELSSSPQIVAIGVNCTAPRFLPSLISELRKVTDKPIVVYPNSGELWDADGKRWLPAHEPVDLAQAAVQWQKQGASLIGGCCRTGPDLIRAMRTELLG